MVLHSCLGFTEGKKHTDSVSLGAELSQSVEGAGRGLVARRAAAAVASLNRWRGMLTRTKRRRRSRSVSKSASMKISRSPRSDKSRYERARCQSRGELSSHFWLGGDVRQHSTDHLSILLAGPWVRIHLPPAKSRPRTSRAKSNPLTPGTEGSNPALSSGESATNPFQQLPGRSFLPPYNM